MKKTSLLKAKITICHMLLAISVFTMSVPMVAFAGDGEGDGTVAGVTNNVNTATTSILTAMQLVFGGAAALVIGYVAFLFLLGGDEGQAKGKKQLGYCVIAFALMFMATAIVTYLKSIFTV